MTSARVLFLTEVTLIIGIENLEAKATKSANSVVSPELDNMNSVSAVVIIPRSP